MRLSWGKERAADIYSIALINPDVLQWKGTPGGGREGGGVAEVNTQPLDVCLVHSTVFKRAQGAGVLT